MSSEPKYNLVVPKEHVKTVKTALEINRVLDKSSKIKPTIHDLQHFIIPTHVTDDSEQGLRALGLDGLKHVLTFQQRGHQPAPDGSSGRGLLQNCVSTWLMQLPSELLDCVSRDELLAQTSKRYSIYPPLLLLPSEPFAGLAWQRLRGRVSAEVLATLYQSITRAFNVTHVAITSPIPALLDGAKAQQNTLRLPTEFMPLYGDFGPAYPPGRLPTARDFTSAFWASAKQNGIFQTWAPRYTMFSRGNIKEKARILHQPSVTACRHHAQGYTALDLYAGIGYFAFSYLKAGAKLVLAFEVNPWSIEGLRRGALENEWHVKIVRHVDFAADTLDKLQDRLQDEMGMIGFEMDMQNASMIVQHARASIPPVRHVNCGLLPTSQPSWRVAVRAVDEALGGWLHIHENIALAEIDAKADWIKAEIYRLLVLERIEQNIVVPVVENVEKVKTYAPGIMHCVLDIYIPPISQ